MAWKENKMSIADSIVLMAYAKAMLWSMGLVVFTIVIHAACTSALKPKNKRYR